MSHSKINIVKIIQLISSLVYDGDQQVLIHSQVNTMMSATVFQCYVALLFMREYDLNSLLLFHFLKYFQFFLRLKCLHLTCNGEIDTYFLMIRISSLLIFYLPQLP